MALSPEGRSVTTMSTELLIEDTRRVLCVSFRFILKNSLDLNSWYISYNSLSSGYTTDRETQNDIAFLWINFFICFVCCFVEVG